MPRAFVILLERDATLRAVMDEHLASGGYKVRAMAAWPEPAKEDLSRTGDLSRAGEPSLAQFADSDAVVAQLNLLPGDPVTTVRALAEQCAVILLPPESGHRLTSAELTQLQEAGAVDVLAGPVDGVTLLGAVHRALRTRRLEAKVRVLEHAGGDFASSGLVGDSAALAAVRREIAQCAAARGPVLVTGETGSGKELVARELHRQSGRRGDFVAVNAPTLAETLFESELFGHEPGAFTGAMGRKLGLVEAADDGTLFLDEIGELVGSVQARLLRFLDDGRFRRVGGIRELEADVRIVAATNRDLAAGMAAAAQGSLSHGVSFRGDLFYRLSAFTIRVPSLRERCEDIPALVAHFRELIATRERAARRSTEELPTLTEDALDLMRRYDWPGNVRELRNLVERALAVAAGRDAATATDITPWLPVKPVTGERTSSALPSSGDLAGDYRDGLAATISEFEKSFLNRALTRFDHNISATARALGMDRKTLASKIRALELG